MRLENYLSKNLEDFKGLYDRGSRSEAPEGFQTEATNIDYEIGELFTRRGLTSSISGGFSAASIRRFRKFTTSHGPIILILDSDGNLYTRSNRTGDSATDPKLTIVGATDFSAIQMLGKIFIAFSDGQKGIEDLNLKVFVPASTEADDEFRDAGSPTDGLLVDSKMILEESDFQGGTDIQTGQPILPYMNPGRYGVAVTYLTSTGHLAEPGPIVAGSGNLKGYPDNFAPTFFTVSADKTIEIQNVPALPGGVDPIWLCTKADQFEFFFVPSRNIIIESLFDTTPTADRVLGFDDTTDLVASADYLFDQLRNIPASLGLENFEGRLVTYGEYSNRSILRVSNPGTPETFSRDEGIVVVNKDDGYEIRNSTVIRRVLYVSKELGLSAIVNNDGVPATWRPVSIDPNSRISSRGIASFYEGAIAKIARDWTLLADSSGIVVFNGTVHKPAITDNIYGIWERINQSQWHKMSLVVDEKNHKIYCSIPVKGLIPGTSETDNDPSKNNALLVGDYNLCPGKIPNIKGIKWAIWLFETGDVSYMSIISDLTESEPTLKVSSVENGNTIWKFGDDFRDDGDLYDSAFTTNLLEWFPGLVHIFAAIRARVTGSGTLRGTISGYDDVGSATIGDIDLVLAPGSEKLLRFNFVNERAKIQFKAMDSTIAGNRNFRLSNLKVYGKKLYDMRPA